MVGWHANVCYHPGMVELFNITNATMYGTLTLKSASIQDGHCNVAKLHHAWCSLKLRLKSALEKWFHSLRWMLLQVRIVHTNRWIKKVTTRFTAWKCVAKCFRQQWFRRGEGAQWLSSKAFVMPLHVAGSERSAWRSACCGERSEQQCFRFILVSLCKKSSMAVNNLLWRSFVHRVVVTFVVYIRCWWSRIVSTPRVTCVEMRC